MRSSSLLLRESVPSRFIIGGKTGGDGRGRFGGGTLLRKKKGSSPNVVSFDVAKGEEGQEERDGREGGIKGKTSIQARTS